MGTSTSNVGRGRIRWAVPAMAAFLGLAGLLGAPGAARGGFVVNDLGPLPGGTSSAGFGINMGGQVCGTGLLGDTTSRAFLGGGSSISSLGTLSGGANSNGYAINDAGRVAGTSDVRIGPGDFRTHAFRTDEHGKLQDFGAFGRDFASAALAMNASGTIAGTSGGGTFTRAVIATAPSAFTDLGTLGGQNAAATAINDGNVVAGWSQVASGAHVAFRTSANGLQSLGTLNGLGSSEATGINQAGDVVGFSGQGDASRAFLSRIDTPGLVELGLLPSATSAIAHAINDRRRVVGEAGFTSGPSHAFLYDAASPNGLYDLNDLIDPRLDITILSATGINGRSMIVGTARVGSSMHAVLLTPEGRSIFDPFAVPEPPAALLLAVGGIGAAAWRRRALLRPA